jgi:hypothetical protein
MRLLITLTRRRWYRKKRFALPICLTTILAIAAIIIGSVLGTRSTGGQRTGKKTHRFSSGDVVRFEYTYQILHVIKHFKMLFYEGSFEINHLRQTCKRIMQMSSHID